MCELTRPLGPIMILDIESAPDPRSVAIAGRGSQISRAALHRLMAASTLSVTEDEDGAWTDIEITSAAGPTELPLLAGIAKRIELLAAAGGTLVTYNGVRHDLPVLCRRAQANWAFNLEGIAVMATLPHVDLIHHGCGRARTPAALRDACAGLGITMNHLIVPREADPLAATIRKGQCDVSATFLLLLHEVALARRAARPLVAGWRAFSERIERDDLRAPHLEQFRMGLQAGHEG